MKILICGEVAGKIDVLYDRVRALNNSRAGPFDCLFCVGHFYPPAEEDTAAFEDYLSGSKEAPVDTYFIEGPTAVAEVKYGAIKAGEELCNRVKYLGSCGLDLVNKLTVGFLASRYTEKELESGINIASSTTFAGTDILLSHHWPQRVAAGHDLSGGELGNTEAGEIGDSVVSDFATLLRPRYHFAASPRVFFQRAPYRNHAKPPVKKRSHITRFISLAEVSMAKEKSKKYLHAINIDAIPYTTLEDLISEPDDVTDSPYSIFNTAVTNVKRSLQEQGLDSDKRSRTGMSHELASQIEAEEEAKRANTGIFFWGGLAGQSGSRNDRANRGGREAEKVPVDPTNTTVFVGGLPPDFSTNRLEPALSPYGQIVKLRAPANRGFAFVEYRTHEEAQACVASRGITLNAPGVKLHWAVSKPHTPADHTHVNRPHKERHTEPSPRFPARKEVDDQSECWFCVGSGKAELELLVSIGQSMYMALPKGPLLPEHVLLVPINHVSALAKLAPPEWSEFENFKLALRRMFAAEGLGMVLFERRTNTRGARHTHVQVVPVPADKSAQVREAFELKGKEFGVFFEVLPHTTSLLDLNLGDSQYFYLECPGLGGQGSMRLLYRLGAMAGHLPVSYGRHVMADLLGTPEKSDWKACQLTKEAEGQIIDVFKLKFAPYDFSVGDG